MIKCERRLCKNNAMENTITCGFRLCGECQRFLLGWLNGWDEEKKHKSWCFKMKQLCIKIVGIRYDRPVEENNT